MKTIIKNAKVMTMNEARTIHDHGYVVIEDGVFTAIEQGEPAEEAAKGANVVNADKKWLMPGLINTHGHTGMSLFRGVSDDVPLSKWLAEHIWPLEQKLDQKAVEAARLLSMVEMIESGTTTFLEMYHLHLDDFAAAIEKAGMRATLMRSVIGLCSKEEQEEKLAESLGFARRWHKQANGRIQTMLAPHAPYTCPPDYIERIVEAARQEGLPVHMHLAETRKEIHDYMDEYGMHPVELLQERDLLSGTEWLFAHGVHMHEQHYELLGAHQAAVSHNPKSNLKLGSGIAQVASMQKHGIVVSLGTDSVASNNALDVFEEMRTAVLLQRGINEQADIVTTWEGLSMATSNGAKALRFANLGTIEVGQQADFIMLNPEQAHLHPSSQAVSHLVFAAKGSDVTDVYVQGVPLMKDKQLLTLDKERILKEANEQFRRLQQ
ncbi:amidohydrolase [Shouchella clausii]|uniref:5-methylthioadenosine/S-adenosylhomocysteine deaminase n=1 Tax=Shouchella clausii TaxID=79880 RepID=A0A268RWQ1_SHOCL|nr:amidohydrolase [Shouchella clausii]PAD41476.1 N-ethylammeline chlorohydrolase [Bacillus sp. 7520-S]AST97707.1 N-ethylammeline chlorohydrolase [Shouchella clausii]MBU8595050.1 amidohydrolase [Shouchella clausii]MCM3549421.1 amidohydrolase [Shouchella clausii]MCY1104508.1 amidohydrolase [Shouchella clausii]